MSRRLQNWLKLSAWAVALWFFFAVLTPRLVALFPAWQRYYAVQEEYNLDSGALYYTNVPITQEAENAMRAAVRRGMEDRRRAAEAPDLQDQIQ